MELIKELRAKKTFTEEDILENRNEIIQKLVCDLFIGLAEIKLKSGKYFEIVGIKQIMNFNEETRTITLFLRVYRQEIKEKTSCVAANLALSEIKKDIAINCFEIVYSKWEEIDDNGKEIKNN